MFALGLADNVRGPLFPELIHFFQLSNTQASSSFALTSSFGFLGNLLAERILRKIRIDQLLVLSLILMALALVGMGLASTFTLYMVAASFFGFSMGLMGIAQNVMVAENITGDVQTKALSGLHSIYGLSSFVAPFVASFAPGILGNWRGGFFVTGAASLFVIMATFFVGSNEKITHVMPSMQEDNKQSKKNNFFVLFMFGGILAFYVVTEILVSSRLALYMRQYFEMDLKQSSLYVTYFFCFLLFGRLGFTFKKFKSSIKFQMNILLILTFICVLLGLLVHPFFLAISGLTMAPYYPLGIAYLSEQTNQHKRQFITFAMGFQNLCLISMHFGVGYLTDHFGLINAFGVGVISILLSLLCINLHPRVST